jgi:hypothetical protein
VTSIETDPQWYSLLKPQLGSNCELILSTRDVKPYSSLIYDKNKFDVIIIDGTGESRVSCSKAAIANLRPGGLIVLDNSDLLLKSSQVLRDSGLIQVDFTGFAPMSAHCHTTSVFFSRDFNFVPLGGYQPHKSVAQPAKPWAGG